MTPDFPSTIPVIRTAIDEYIHEISRLVKVRNPGEPEFQQAVFDVISCLPPILTKKPDYREYRILERMIEPERVISFRVAWTDDRGSARVNRGYRIEMNSAIGPYKGGLRFHPSIGLGTLKFLAFEQVFKNSLTTLPLGGGKGGADFDPKDKSENEVMRFCHSFMTELWRHIGPNKDIPAGDIGVGKREIGFLFGQYKRISNEFTGALTGKGVEWGGSLLRPEATGYGCVYFASEMLKSVGESFEDQRCLVSGSGNVAQYTIEKLLDVGAKPLTVSDSEGAIYDADGIDREKLAWIMDLKNVRRGRIRAYKDEFPRAIYMPVDPARKYNPLWSIPADCAFPSATQNEINDTDARTLIKNGVTLVCEGANMPSSHKAIQDFIQAKILYGPAKAANAGGVAASGLEMTQNSMRLQWTRSEVEDRLREIMVVIHRSCLETAAEYGNPGNLVVGANIEGFRKVADAMLDQGLV